MAPSVNLVSNMPLHMNQATGTSVAPALTSSGTLKKLTELKSEKEVFNLTVSNHLAMSTDVEMLSAKSTDGSKMLTNQIAVSMGKTAKVDVQVHASTTTTSQLKVSIDAGKSAVSENKTVSTPTKALLKKALLNAGIHRQMAGKFDQYFINLFMPLAPNNWFMEDT